MLEITKNRLVFCGLTSRFDILLTLISILRCQVICAEVVVRCLALSIILSLIERARLSSVL